MSDELPDILIMIFAVFILIALLIYLSSESDECEKRGGVLVRGYEWSLATCVKEIKE